MSMDEADQISPAPQQGGLADMLNSLTVFGKDALWWGMVWMGCYVAYQQGYSPFKLHGVCDQTWAHAASSRSTLHTAPGSTQPPNPRPEHANARAAAREQAAAAAAAETEEQPAVPEDPVSQRPAQVYLGMFACEEEERHPLPEDISIQPIQARRPSCRRELFQPLPARRDLSLLHHGKQTRNLRSQNTTAALLADCEVTSPDACGVQEEHKAAMDALMARAQEKATQMNDKKLTVEHMILALAGNPSQGSCTQPRHLQASQGGLAV
eukprot:1158884-Pelagomonas_calceolata.AAC.1